MVDIDEMCYRGRKLLRGRAVHMQWILGIRERESGTLIVETIPDRSAQTLLSIIMECVKEGSIINTYCWSSYSQLDQLGYTHNTVNHKYFHVNKRTGTHIQLVERSWREFHRLVPKYGIRKGSVGTKLSKFIFTYTFPLDTRIFSFLTILRDVHNPN